MFYELSLKSALWKHAGNMGEGIDGIHALGALGDAAMLQIKANFLSIVCLCRSLLPLCKLHIFFQTHGRHGWRRIVRKRGREVIWSRIWFRFFFDGIHATAGLA